MANVKISELPSLSTMTNAAEIPVVASGTTQQITGANLKTFFTGNVGFAGDTMYDLNGVSVNNSDLSHGLTATMTIPSNGNTTAPIQLINTYGNVTIGTGPAGTVAGTWNFNDDVELNLPGQGVIRNSTNAVGAGVNLVSNNFSQLQWVDSGNVNNPDPNNTNGPTNWAYVDTNGFNIETNIHNPVITNSYFWSFGTDGNLVLPGNAGPTNGKITSTVDGSIVRLEGQNNGIVSLRSHGSTGNNAAQISVFGNDADVDRVFIQTLNPGFDEFNTWAFNTAGDLTTPDAGNIFLTSGAHNAVIDPGASAVRIAADRTDTTVDYVEVSDSGITLNAQSSHFNNINIRAGDDVKLYGGNKVAAPQADGGAVFVYGGDGGADGGANAGDGGDVELIGGLGGNAINGGAGGGGTARLWGGDGGAANEANALLAGNGGSVILVGGSAGNNLGNLSLSAPGGNVDLYGGAGSWDAANSIPVGNAGHVNLYGGNWGWITPSGNIYLNTYNGSDFRTLSYDNTGNITLPYNGSINLNNGGIVQYPQRDLKILVQDSNQDGWALKLEVNDGTTVGSRIEQTLDQIQIGTNLATQAHYWQFDQTGLLTLPGDINGVFGGNLNIQIPGSADTSSITLKTVDNASTLRSNLSVHQNSITISTNTAGYTWTFDNAGDMFVPNDGAILTANATGGLGGQAITIQAGASDPVTWNSNPGGTLNLRGGYGSFGDGTGGAGGPVNIYGGLSSDSVSGNVNIFTGTTSQYNWKFDNTGNLTVPGKIQGAATYNQPNLLQINSSDAEWAYGSYASGSDFWMQTKFFGQNQITRGVRFYEAESNTVVFSVDGAGNATVNNTITSLKQTLINGDDASGSGHKTQIQFGFNGADDYQQWIATRHNNSRVNNAIDFYTSDGTQNGSFVGNAILGGSITQGAMQLAVYANATVRDATITTPAPGMMIYVTGTGMQVYGATSWNTIAGSGT